MTGQPRPSWRGSRYDDRDLEDLMSIKLVLLLAGPGLLAFAGMKWDDLQGWAVAHDVLLPADQSWWTLPWSHTGLDLWRTIVFFLVSVPLLAGALAIAASARRRQMRRALKEIGHSLETGRYR